MLKRRLQPSAKPVLPSASCKSLSSLPRQINWTGAVRAFHAAISLQKRQRITRLTKTKLIDASLRPVPAAPARPASLSLRLIQDALARPFLEPIARFRPLAGAKEEPVSAKVESKSRGLASDPSDAKAAIWTAIYSKESLNVKRDQIARAVTLYLESPSQGRAARAAALIAIAAYCDIRKPFPVLAHRLAADMGSPETWRIYHCRPLIIYLAALARRQTQIDKDILKLDLTVTRAAFRCAFDPLASASDRESLEYLQKRISSLTSEANSLWTTMSLFLDKVLGLMQTCALPASTYISEAAASPLNVVADLAARKGNTEIIIRLRKVWEQAKYQESARQVRALAAAYSENGMAAEAGEQLARLQELPEHGDGIMQYDGDMKRLTLHVWRSTITAFLRAGRPKAASALMTKDFHRRLTRYQSRRALINILGAALRNGAEDFFSEELAQLESRYWRTKDSLIPVGQFKRLINLASRHKRLDSVVRLWHLSVRSPLLRSALSIDDLAIAAIPFCRLAVQKPATSSAILNRVSRLFLDSLLFLSGVRAAQALCLLYLRCICAAMVQSRNRHNAISLVRQSDDILKFSDTQPDDFVKIVDIAMGEFLPQSASNIGQGLFEEDLFEGQRVAQASLLEEAFELRKRAGRGAWPPSTWWTDEAARLRPAQEVAVAIEHYVARGGARPRGQPL